MIFPFIPKFVKSLVSRRQSRQLRRPLVFEPLEDRLAPAVIAWDGGPAATGTSWSDPANWAGDVLPAATDDADIGSAFAGVTITSSSDVTIRSMTSAAALQVTAGTFALGAAASRIDAAFTVGGGTLRLTQTTLNGTGTLTNAATLELIGSTLHVPLLNQGALVARGSTALNGPVTTASASTLRAEGTLTADAFLTVAQGFSNQGTIELTSLSSLSSRLTVTNGTLTNAANGTISALGSSQRLLVAQLDNRGTLNVGTSLTIQKASAAHSNSGTITLTGGNLTLDQTGTSPSFANTGSISIGSGRSFTMNGGTFHHNDGTIDGRGTWSLSGTTANFGTDFSNTLGALTASFSTLNSSGTLTNLAGKTLSLTSGATVNATLANEGTLLVQSGTLNGAFSNLPGSVLRVGGISGSAAVLTVAQGFTNQGTIELTGLGAADSHLTVTSGTLINAAGATILISPGGQRFLQAQLDNRGTLSVGTGLTVTKSSAAHSNSGTITLTGGNLTIDQAGSFTNSGIMEVGDIRTLTITAGGLINNGSGILVSHPTSMVAITGNLVGQTTNADHFAPQGTVRFPGPAPTGNPQLLEVMGHDRGNGAAGLTNNFAFGTVSLVTTTVRLVDNADNSPGAGPEAIYVNSLIVPAGTTLDLNGLRLYARQVQINGTILGGAVNLVPDGGPIPFRALRRIM